LEIDWKQLTAVAKTAMEKAYAPYLVSELYRTGGGKLVAFACVDGKGDPLMPCGRCRQLLFEHAAEGMLLQTISGIKPITEVLPDAFGPKDLGK